MKTSVFIIEDDFEFGKSLQTLLAANPLLEVAGIASNLEGARQHILSQENDIYLVDITLPDGSGIEMMKIIHSRYPNSKILALSTLGDEKHIFNSIQAGASGYLLKSEMPTNIIQSIINLINDGGYLSGHASKVLIKKFLSISAEAQRNPIHFGAQPRAEIFQVENRPPTLTRKEFEILSNAQNGSPAKIIADSLGISIFTVNQHLRSIYRKLNVRNKMEAVQSARRQGLL
jgi:DNA-binding NarL/FixJ family response regulator